MISDQLLADKAPQCPTLRTVVRSASAAERLTLDEHRFALLSPLLS
jgi:hypothetical protein